VYLCSQKITSSQVDIKNYCIEYDMEACVLKVHLDNTIIHILTIYRSPAGDFSKFLETLDNILRLLINPKTEIVICGDINVNYLININRKYQLNSLLNSYNFMDTVDIPTRTQCTSVSIIDNIFIDYSRINNYSISPCYNGISDHDGQLIKIYNTINSQPMSNLYVIRKIN
jgi:exonuclease III